MNGIFTCPICGGTLTLSGKSLICEKSHCFDVAKSGYVNLLPVGRKNSVSPGDNKDMIKSRVAVMNKGYYKALSEKIIGILGTLNLGKILDAGCGTGYILNEIKQVYKAPVCIGTDISKYAIEQASKLYKDPVFAVASSIRLPLESECVSAVICAFAPVYAEEFSRVLEGGGLLIRVVPAVNHLLSLKEYIYDDARVNIQDETEFAGFTLTDAYIVSSTVLLQSEEVKSLIKMTPYYYHTSTEKLARLDEIDEFNVRTEFEVRVFKKTEE